MLLIYSATHIILQAISDSNRFHMRQFSGIRRSIFQLIVTAENVKSSIA